MPEADHPEVVEAYEAQKQAAELLKSYRKRARLRTARPQPAAQERREGAQAYLLAKYEEIGNMDETLWDLLQLRIRDLEAYRQVLGTDKRVRTRDVPQILVRHSPRGAGGGQTEFPRCARIKGGGPGYISTGWAPFPGSRAGTILRACLVRPRDPRFRLALSKAEAAKALGVSVDFLEDHLLAELRVVRVGRRILIPVAELERWLAEHSERLLPDP